MCWKLTVKLLAYMHWFCL